MKKAFALIVALVFVMFVASIGAIYAKQAFNVRSLGIVANSLGQQNALITDATAILTNQGKLVNSNEALSVFLAAVKQLSYSSKEYELSVNGQSLQSKIPFNRCEFNSTKSPCRNLISHLSSNDNFSEYLSGHTIDSYPSFVKILENYILITQDVKLKKIPWQDYFVFSEYSEDYIDCDNISPKLWNALKEIYSINSTTCSQMLKNKAYPAIAQTLKLKNFKDGNKYALKLSIKLKQNNNIAASTTIYYDIGTKKTLGIKADI